MTLARLASVVWDEVQMHRSVGHWTSRWPKVAS